ncbi:hypothetical protein SD77_4188 [Bacillus badius]|uniref:Uncharacterized protein n=2 Tax=Bacillus badius TaxID=1455 RepID=A0ABR5AUT6_BACBA|nr:hypothetical protein SD78_0492 [Bacillus badius]KIL78508.1 hypothetical protein SD77_4188 [Bacillus badius]
MKLFSWLDRKQETTSAEKGETKMTNAMKWITGGLEAFFGIPILGGMIILGHAWAPLGFMAVLHIITLLIALNAGKSLTGSILGIIASAIGWIPIVGMVMHWITALVLISSAFRNK